MCVYIYIYLCLLLTAVFLMGSIFLGKRDDSQAPMYCSNLLQPEEAGRAKIQLRMSGNNAEDPLINHRLDLLPILLPISMGQNQRKCKD